MKQTVANYTFSASAKTVTLTDLTTVRLDRLYLIVNVTRNTIMYNFADPAVATATVATNVVTLSAIPVGAADADKLIIVYDTVTADALLSTPELVAGQIASGGTDAGNPVKIGGVYRATPPTVTDAQRVDAQMTNRGALVVTPYAAGSAQSAFSNAAITDTVANTTTAFVQLAFGMIFNGTSWERQRGVTDASILTSAARTATTNGADQTNYNWTGVQLFLNITVEAAAETLSLKIQGKDSISSGYVDLVDFGTVYTSASEAPGLKTAILYPTIGTDVATGVFHKQATLPRTWRPVVTHSAAGSWTYSLSASMLL